MTLRGLPDLHQRCEIERASEAVVRRCIGGRRIREGLAQSSHRDLKRALEDGSAVPLPDVEMNRVTDALASFEAIINTISFHFKGPEHRFQYMHKLPPHTGAVQLIYLLDDALTVEKERQARIAAGDYSRSDPARDL